MNLNNIILSNTQNSGISKTNYRDKIRIIVVPLRREIDGEKI